MQQVRMKTREGLVFAFAFAGFFLNREETIDWQYPFLAAKSRE